MIAFRKPVSRPMLPPWASPAASQMQPTKKSQRCPAL
jgi:hypothetical protein